MWLYMELLLVSSFKVIILTQQVASFCSACNPFHSILDFADGLSNKDRETPNEFLGI